MNETAIIFGAGRTGRGFSAHLAFLGGYDIILVDKNRLLVEALQKAGHYKVEVLNNEQKNSRINILSAHHVADNSWHQPLVYAHILFTAVFGNNLDELGKMLGPALEKRFVENPHQLLTIITCENLTGAAEILKQSVLIAMDEKKKDWLNNTVGFSEAMVLRTCLASADGPSSLTIRAQNFFELPCDGEAIKDTLHVFGLRPLKKFGNQLRRKIFTYNCINAVITYLGAQKKYEQLYEAANDPEILMIARKAAEESSSAQLAEWGFDEDEQRNWVEAAFEKFSDDSIPDPLERNAADPVRKLGRDDRLIGPALLAIRHGIEPSALLEAVMACFDYKDPSTQLSVTDIMVAKGTGYVLKQVCGLDEHEILYQLITERTRKIT